jgi:carbamoyltransferase
MSKENMNYIGISAGFHDAALSVVGDGKILFAGHGERYTGVKCDKEIQSSIVTDALSYINGDFELHYYERPWVKFLRQIYTGENYNIFNINPKNGLSKNAYDLLEKKKIHTHGHHLSHAAAGFQTSIFKEATVLVIDAIGELDTISIWDARYNNKGKAVYKKLYSKKYPNSLGLFYSALTERVGLKPNEEEYITMGMAAYGTNMHYTQMYETLVQDSYDIEFKENLHIGLPEDFLLNASNEDLACSGQLLLEGLLTNVLSRAKILGRSKNLVYGGGVALNCLANRLLGKYFDNIWIMPNPGDAGSSLGAALLGYGYPVNYADSFLGYNIPGPYPVDNLLNNLLTDKIVGVASGRAEFGPRALGNRSLLADPRGKEIKDKVNEIKKRQKFRPFAPVILEEHVHNYFMMPLNWRNSKYMQVVAKCKNPERFPAIVHADGTSRVQTVSKDGSGIRELLENWFKLTGCPMLLNTSLNIRGEPMVNTRADADRFQQLYNIKVLS